MDDDTLQDLVEQNLPADEATWLLALRRPAVALDPAPSGHATHTRLGGMAMLSPGDEWPRWGDKPLSLIQSCLTNSPPFPTWMRNGWSTH